MIPMAVTLGPSALNQTISVQINDDADFEGVESFVLELNFTGGDSIHRLNLSQPNSTITIFDDDGKIWMIIINFTIIINFLIEIAIGFTSTAYTVNENRGEIQLPVEVNGAVLKKEISLNITTCDGSAVGRPTIL